MTDDDDDEHTVRVFLKGRLMVHPPPPDALQAEIESTLSRHPNGLARAIVPIDAWKIFFICGPLDENNVIQVDVWERDEAEAMFRNAGQDISFFEKHK
jgi:hypothetical protein